MFHVPEAQRITNHPSLASTSENGNNGAFLVESNKEGWILVLICSDEENWEHVSIHVYNLIGQMRTPTWSEMCQIKDLCWDEEDVVMQLHPSKSKYINCHPNTLHLWRPIKQVIPTPPEFMV